MPRPFAEKASDQTAVTSVSNASGKRFGGRAPSVRVQISESKGNELFSHCLYFLTYPYDGLEHKAERYAVKTPC